MQLNSSSFRDGGRIPAEQAFAVMDPVRRVTLGANRNPHLAWSEVPVGTKSFALICHDPDVPIRGDDVNQEGKEVPASLPRIEFFHWVLIDIPAEAREIKAASHSHRVTPGGKPGPEAGEGLRHGVNGFTQWFAGDASMRGKYFGYDGPAPPWNDALMHRYVFTLYALDVPRLEVKGEIDGSNVRAALSGHILAEAKLTGTYSLNPKLHKSNGSAAKP